MDLCCGCEGRSSETASGIAQAVAQCGIESTGPSTPSLLTAWGGPSPHKWHRASQRGVEEREAGPPVGGRASGWRRCPEVPAEGPLGWPACQDVRLRDICSVRQSSSGYVVEPPAQPPAQRTRRSRISLVEGLRTEPASGSRRAARAPPAPLNMQAVDEARGGPRSSRGFLFRGRACALRHMCRDDPSGRPLPNTSALWATCPSVSLLM